MSSLSFGTEACSKISVWVRLSTTISACIVLATRHCYIVFMHLTARKPSVQLLIFFISGNPHHSSFARPIWVDSRSSRLQKYPKAVTSRGFQGQTTFRKCGLSPNDPCPLMTLSSRTVREWMLLAVDSTGRRNRLAKSFSGCFVV